MKNIVILGRPNVGKSTLFNRLVGKRRAITDPTPGVTRDPISDKWIIFGHAVNLTDSGGVRPGKKELDGKVSAKSMSLTEDADLILFLMDCMEVTAEDCILLKDLRKYEEKTILVVNKIDDVTREDLLWNYYEFGYKRVVGISSSHGLGIDALEETVMGLLDLENEEEESQEEQDMIKLAVLGKPNTGKSTLVNLLTGKELSIVSSVAGTTRDVVSGTFSYKGNNFTVLDTAGIRRKSKVEEDVEYYSVNRAIKTIDEADVVLLVIDCKEGLAEQDKKIASLIVRRGKGVVLVLNKTDLLEHIGNETVAMEDRVRFFFPVLNFAPISFISAKEATAIDKMLDTVLKVYKQLNKRIETAVLNTAVKKWTESYTPPRGNEGHYKVLYGTQISASPVKFLFFVNRRKGFPLTYIQYLKNCIRKDFGFAQIPVEIDLRERERSESNHKLGENSRVKKASAERPMIKQPSAKKTETKKTGGKAKAAVKKKKVGAKAKARAVQEQKTKFKSKKFR